MDVKFYYIKKEALDHADTIPYTLYFAYDTETLAYDDSRANRRIIKRMYLYPTERARSQAMDFDPETLYIVIESNRIYTFDYYAGWIQMGPDYFYYFEIPFVILEPANVPKSLDSSNILELGTCIEDDRFREDSIPQFIIDPSLRDLIDDNNITYETGDKYCIIKVKYTPKNPSKGYKEIYGRVVVSNYEGTGFSGSGAEMYTNDHNQLQNRNAENSHPIEAISGLDEFSINELLNMWGRSDFINQLMENLSGTMDHDQLINRNDPGAHPIEAISGIDEIDNTVILNLWNQFIDPE